MARTSPTRRCRGNICGWCPARPRSRRSTWTAATAPVNGVALTGLAALVRGDVVRLGRSEVTAPSGFIALADRVLGIDPTGEKDLFPPTPSCRPECSHRSARARASAASRSTLQSSWRCSSVPAAGPFVFFGVIAPLWSILFLVAPGLWRHVCPLAATNQIPRVFGFSRTLNPPAWLPGRGYLIAVTLFFGILLLACHVRGSERARSV